jgi:hypothetical protein
MVFLTFAVVWLLFMSSFLYWKLRALQGQLDAMQAQMYADRVRIQALEGQGARLGRAVPVEGGRALLMRLIDEHDSRRPGSNGNA